jgi:hypothetical protein
MKNILITTAIMFSALLTNAQARVTSTGISIQGIAKDGNNAALVNQAVPIAIEIYYTANSTNFSIASQTGTVNTDGFGFFAYVVNIDSSKFIKISNREAYIKISANGVIFANEKLQAVPYAIYAQNGVPTGTVMPFAGETIPDGWLLADGSAIPSDEFYKPLRDMLGSSFLPNLKGLFLRGAGAGTSYTGPNLQALQLDAIQSHAHSLSYTGSTTSTDGSHTHDGYQDRGGSTNHSGTYMDGSNGGDEQWLGSWLRNAGAHTHIISGNGTSSNPNIGAVETRPVNYGVNFIIKI